MAERLFVYCPLLCFLAKRYSILDLKVLKSTLLDFYLLEDISRAKLQLEEDLDKLILVENLCVDRPRLPRRINSEQRIRHEVDDIINLFTFVDEKKISHKLPIYVAAGPDEMPYMRVVDSDFHLLVQKMARMETMIMSLLDDVQRLTVQVQTQPQLTATSMTSSAALVPVTGMNTVNNVNNVQGAKKQQPGISAATTSGFGKSTPCHSSVHDENVQAVATTELLEHDSRGVSADENNEWFTVTGRKRARVFSDFNKAALESTERVADDEVRPRQNKPLKSTRLLIGKKAGNVSVGSVSGSSLLGLSPTKSAASVISAAKPYLGKSVFCVDNVSTSVTVDSLSKFVKSLNVNVISCFQVNPRRTRWQKESGIFPKDRNTFRLCVAREDVKKLLNAEAWPAHISISAWSFKRNQAENVQNIDTNTDRSLISDVLRTSVASSILPNRAEGTSASSVITDEVAAEAAGEAASSDQSLITTPPIGRWEDALSDMESTVIYSHDGDEN